MEQLVKHEPQELHHADRADTVRSREPCSPREGGTIQPAEESKSDAEDCTDVSAAGKQPQSLIMQVPPLRSIKRQDKQLTNCVHPDVRALQLQLAQLKLENEDLRRRLDQQIGGEYPLPAELKWLIYFRVPADPAFQEQARAVKAQVLAIVRDGLIALLAKDPSFRARECATSWAAQEHPNWRAFRVDYVGYKLAAFRTAMKAALADAQLPANALVRTTQPPAVSLYRQMPDVPPLFTGTLEELAAALRDAMERVFIP